MRRPKIVTANKTQGLPLDLSVVDNGLVFAANGEDHLDYLWFELVEREAGREYHLHRAVQLKLLRYLPQEARQDAGVLDTMRAALTGVYNQRVAQYDPCMLVAGIFDPPLGVIQCYGAVGVGEDAEQAARNAGMGMGAVEGVLANFPQSRLEALDVQKAEWLRRAFLEMKQSLVVIGQPDPRMSAKGMGREGPSEKQNTMTGETAYTLQQNEMLFRALARLEEEFLFLVLASRVRPGDLATMLEGLAAEASVPASRQMGSKAISFGISFPLMGSGGLARSAGTSFGRNEGESVSDSVSESETDTHTEGHASTSGFAVTDGVAHTVGRAHTTGSSSTTSVSHNEGTSETRGESHGTTDTVGYAQTRGLSSTSGGTTSVSSAWTHVPEISSYSGADPDNAPRDISISIPPTTQNAGETKTPDAGIDPTKLIGIPPDAAPSLPAPADPYDVPNPPGPEGEFNTIFTHPPTGGELSPPALRMAPEGETFDAGSIPPTGGGGGGGSPIPEPRDVVLQGLEHLKAGGSGNITLHMPGTSKQFNSSIKAGLPGLSASIGGSDGTSQPGATVTLNHQHTFNRSESGPKGDPSAADMPAIANAALDGDFSGIPDGMGVGYRESAGGTRSTTPAHTITSGSSGYSSMASTTRSASDTMSESHGVSQSRSHSRGASQGVSRSTSHGSFSSTTSSESHTTSHAETRSSSETASTSDSHSRGVTRGRGVGRSSGTNMGQMMNLSRMMGASAGVVPSISASKSYQWQDDKAIQLTQLLRAQEELLRQATLEGAYLTDAYMLCRTERGAAAAEAALRQAFHGSELPVVTPVQTRRLTAEEQAYIRLHALAFTQSTREETVGGALEAYKDSTMLLPLQLAAYMAPGLFEEGAAVTTQERIPAFAFVPDMPGQVVLGHLWSTETGRLTGAQLRLDEARMFHTAFAADTGYGKTVAAERLAVETTRKWRYRTVVFDFGAGWRRMLNAPLGEAGRVEVWQVFPGATVPLRWNPLQIGRRINPERQMRATCELVRNAGQMGPRQMGYMRRTLKELYLEHGVLTSFREVLADDRWNTVREEEWDAVDAARAEWELGPRRREGGVHLADLESFERQAVAVQRSKAVDMTMWCDRLNQLLDGMRVGSPDHTSLEGVLLRLEPFTEGEMEQMYGRGEGSIAIEELGMLGPAEDAWGISVLEGGAEMDEFAKAVVFSLAGWHLYNDAVVRRRLHLGRATLPTLQVFFEEANKVLSGVAVDVGDQDSGSGSTSEIWQTMWRDGRKYGIWLHLIAQTVSDLPAGILSSCNNAFYSQTKDARDRDQIMAHLAFSEKGFTDEDYKRFISRMPAAMSVCKLGYSMDIIHTTPFLCRPVMVPGQEPTDAELLQHHVAMRAARRGAVE